MGDDDVDLFVSISALNGAGVVGLAGLGTVCSTTQNERTSISAWAISDAETIAVS